VDEIRDALARVGAVLVAASAAIIWALVVLAVVLPRAGQLTTAFVASPGGLIITVLGWRVLDPRRRRR